MNREKVLELIDSGLLSKRERRLLHARYIEGATIEQAATAIQLTVKGAEVIERKAMIKLDLFRV